MEISSHGLQIRRVQEKGQNGASKSVIIPKDFVKELKIKKGDDMLIMRDENKIIMAKPEEVMK